MRIIDADELKKMFPDKGEGAWTYNITAKAYIDVAPTVDLWHYPSRGEYPTDNVSYVLVAKDNEVFYGAYVDPLEQWVIYPLNGMQTRYYASKVDAWMLLPEPPKEEV